MTRRCVRELPPARRACPLAARTPLIRPRRQLEEDNREVLRLLRDQGVPEKLEGLKRLIAQSARPRTKRLSNRTPTAQP